MRSKSARYILRLEPAYSLASYATFYPMKTTLIQTSDVRTLLEFVLYIANEADDANRWARLLVSKIISNTPVMPKSLFLTGPITMPNNRDFIGGGASGSCSRAHSIELTQGLTIL